MGAGIVRHRRYTAAYPTDAQGKELPPIGGYEPTVPSKPWKSQRGLDASIARLPSVDGIRPAPIAGGEFAERLVGCQSDSACLRVAAVFGWPRLDCQACEVFQIWIGAR